MKKTNLLLALATTLVATSCSQDVIQEPTIPDSEKTKIEFVASDASAYTRAGFTGIDGTNTSQKTLIVARFSSKKKNTSSVRHTRTTLLAGFDSQANGGKNWSTCSMVDFNGDDYKRYWDDCFGRDALLSIYAIAVPNKPTAVTNANKTLEEKLTPGSTQVGNTKWYSDAESNSVHWEVTNVVNPASGETQYTAQNASIIANEDLSYSNNIKDGGKDGRFEYGTSGYPSYLYKAHTTTGDDACSHENYMHDYYPNMTDGEMAFKLESSAASDGPGHFDHGHMIFKHALTRITVDIKGGTGFDYTNASNFSFKSQKTNYPATVDLLQMNTKGDLDIKAGTWSNFSTSDDTYMSCGTKATGDNFAKDKVIYSLSAQVLPGYKVTKNKTDNNFMTFNIDDNNYYVTEKEIFDALNTSDNTTINSADGSSKVTVSSDQITLEQGKNYHFTITVNKTGISALTCTLVDWVDVEGSFAAKNSYIEFTSLETSATGDKDCTNFDLYRVLNTSSLITSPTQKEFVEDGTHKIQYMTGYASDSSPVADMVSTASTSAETKITVKTAGSGSTKTVFTTPWYFQDNYSFYHFRSVIPGTIITKEEATDKGDYFTMYSGPINDTYPTTGSPTFPTQVIDGNETAVYNDYHWGAIFKPTATGYTANLKYDVSDGFKNSLTGPVGPTTSTLNLIEQHMMSNIKVVLLTPSDGDAAKSAVDLYVENAAPNQDPGNVSTINLTNFQGKAKVRMGNGLITPEGDRISKTLTKPTYTKETDDATPSNNYCENKAYTIGNATQKYYKTKEYTYRVVPQALVVEDKKVGLTIQTPDNNMYYVVEDLAKIEVSRVSGNALKNDYEGWNNSETKKVIDRWLPGYTYTYYFILTKTGIQALTCTIVDWVTVDGKPFDITLEN